MIPTSEDTWRNCSPLPQRSKPELPARPRLKLLHLAEGIEEVRPVARDTRRVHVLSSKGAPILGDRARLGWVGLRPPEPFGHIRKVGVERHVMDPRL